MVQHNSTHNTTHCYTTLLGGRYISALMLSYCNRLFGFDSKTGFLIMKCATKLRDNLELQRKSHHSYREGKMWNCITHILALPYQTAFWVILTGWIAALDILSRVYLCQIIVK